MGPHQRSTHDAIGARTLQQPGKRRRWTNRLAEALTLTRANSISGPVATSVLQDFRQELLRPLAARLAEEVRSRRILNDFTFVHENNAVGDLAGKAHFVGDHD